MDLSDKIGRRLKLQDLNVLMTVAQAGSMGKAAQRLNTTQPAVSRTISELETALGVRLLDRSRHGVEPTTYGRALLHCAAAVFDDLRQGIKNIEFLSDPTFGEIRIGGDETVIGGLVSTVLARLRSRYRGITIHITHIGSLSDQYRELRDRKIDLVLGQVPSTIDVEDDIEAQVLYEDRIVVAAGLQSRWSNRRKIELDELVDEAWALPAADTVADSLVQQAFRARKINVRGAATGSPHLLLSLMARGPFLAAIPDSMLRFETNLPPLKVLPLELSIPGWPVGAMMLKHRTMSPVAELFLDSAREAVQTILHKK
jgi:DNA-binding transcriptional LysR family regulator